MDKMTMNKGKVQFMILLLKISAVKIGLVNLVKTIINKNTLNCLLERTKKQCFPSLSFSLQFCV